MMRLLAAAALPFLATCVEGEAAASMEAEVPEECSLLQHPGIYGDGEWHRWRPRTDPTTTEEPGTTIVEQPGLEGEPSQSATSWTYFEAPVDYKCGGKYTMVFFPSASTDDGQILSGGPYTVVVAMHGTGGCWDGSTTPRAPTSSGPTCDGAYIHMNFRKLAALGMIVVAPYTGGSAVSGCNSTTQWMDAYTAVWAAKNQDRGRTPVLDHATFDRIGVYGYSMGGKSAPEAAMQMTEGSMYSTTFNVRGVVAYAGARNSSHMPSIPSMYLSEEYDSESTAWDCGLHTGDSCTPIGQEFFENDATHKFFVVRADEYHSYPVTQGKGKDNVWAAAWFSCWVAQNSDDCKYFDPDESDGFCNDASTYKVCRNATAGFGTISPER